MSMKFFTVSILYRAYILQTAIIKRDIPQYSLPYLIYCCLFPSTAIPHRPHISSIHGFPFVSSHPNTISGFMYLQFLILFTQKKISSFFSNRFTYGGIRAATESEATFSSFQQFHCNATLNYIIHTCSLCLMLLRIFCA
jgi:hypothetical protein